MCWEEICIMVECRDIVTILKDMDFEMAEPTYELKQDGWFNPMPVGFEVKVKSRGS